MSETSTATRAVSLKNPKKQRPVCTCRRDRAGKTRTALLQLRNAQGPGKDNAKPFCF